MALILNPIRWESGLWRRDRDWLFILVDYLLAAQSFLLFVCARLCQQLNPCGLGFGLLFQEFFSSDCGNGLGQVCFLHGWVLYLFYLSFSPIVLLSIARRTRAVGSKQIADGLWCYWCLDRWLFKHLYLSFWVLRATTRGRKPPAPHVTVGGPNVGYKRLEFNKHL